MHRLIMSGLKDNLRIFGITMWKVRGIGLVWLDIAVSVTALITSISFRIHESVTT